MKTSLRGASEALQNFVNHTGLAYEENEAKVRALTQLIATGESVALVGAGISMGKPSPITEFRLPEKSLCLFPRTSISQFGFESHKNFWRETRASLRRETVSKTACRHL